MSENNNISRRQFLEVAGGALALYTTSPLWLRLGAAGAEPAPAAGRKLLLLLMEGGNDGLNTVVPYGHSAYFEKPAEFNAAVMSFLLEHLPTE